MAQWQERLAYLEGMAKGLALERHLPEGPVLMEMLGVLQGIAHEIEEITDEQDELSDYMMEIDEDLEALEEEYWGDESEEEVDTFELNCPRCGIVLEWDEDPEEAEVLDLTCPNCGEVIVGEEQTFEEVHP